ncbi:metal ABC transporter solute-binding protein, Zn/Mn family [Actinospica robiniae]|uniref:metal ABC transporter solute-binding protein, Zn/Mn family n=1 Tax=Actinospica robiniae TaxID=304901 RepID=UPI00040FC2F4|nr:zinc ABC transporter substrate-binding protein [Actinospica robiniae]
MPSTSARPAHRLSLFGRALCATLALSAAALLTSACSYPSGSGSGSDAAGSAANSKIVVVGAENEYADVLGQIGGRYVAVSAVMSNPNTDPHTYEASPQVAAEVSRARLVVQNGLGYDDFMHQIEQSSGHGSQQVIDVQQLLALPDSTANPHLWYQPTTMPAVASAVAADLASIDPAHKAYYAANLATFKTSFSAYTSAITELKTRYGGAAVATTEPVADYLLDAAGVSNLTPWAFQAAVMNGTDPSPQDVAAQQALFTEHKIKAFVYNQQVTDSLTTSLLTLAKDNGIPIVGVYETMPTPGYDYQKWMLAEVAALSGAIGSGQSAPTL